MNLPNRLTLLRVLLIPPFVCFLLSEGRTLQIAAAAIFVLASATDFFDGWYARRHDLITDFGKLMDPMADKLLVMAALIGLVADGRCPPLAAMLVLAREFVISAIRLVAAAEGKVIAAGRSGKYKTASQMIAIPMLIIGGALQMPGEIFLWISVALSVWSCLIYIIANKEVFKNDM